MQSSTSPYKLLGVDKKASPEEVRKAYKQRALETHPDKLQPGCTVDEKEEADARFRLVYEAFELLNDPIKRREYDRRRGSRADTEKRWADRDEQSRRRAEERQAWAAQAELRYQERMRALREDARRTRQAYLEHQHSEREDAQMIAQMLDMLCRLDAPRAKAKSRDGSKPRQRTAEEMQPEATAAMAETS